MPSITFTLPVAGTDADAGPIATNFSDLQTLLNGGLDNTNIASGAAIAVTKLAGGSDTQVLTMSGSTVGWATPASPSSAPAGSISAYAGLSAPSGWLICDGSSQLRATYPDLFAAVSLSKGTFTVTIASPAVFTKTTHGLVVGDAVYLTTTGALPTGLSANTTYYVSNVPTADTFRVSATRGGADINSSGSQSGTHTLIQAPYGVADSTHFNLPDMRGRVPVGKGTHADVATIGLDEGVAVGSRRPKHKHTTVDHTSVSLTNAAGGSDFAVPRLSTGADPFTVGPQTGSEPTDSEAYLSLNYIIKT